MTHSELQALIEEAESILRRSRLPWFDRADEFRRVIPKLTEALRESEEQREEQQQSHAAEKEGHAARRRGEQFCVPLSWGDHPLAWERGWRIADAFITILELKGSEAWRVEAENLVRRLVAGDLNSVTDARRFLDDRSWRQRSLARELADSSSRPRMHRDAHQGVAAPPKIEDTGKPEGGVVTCVEIDLNRISDAICKSLCASVRVRQESENRLFVETPFYFSDGDAYSIYLERLPSGAVRITDCGHTLMQLSYRMDVDKLREGTRGRLFESILDEAGVSEENGEFFVDSTVEEAGPSLVRLGQMITRLLDLSFLVQVIKDSEERRIVDG